MDGGAACRMDDARGGIRADGQRPIRERRFELPIPHLGSGEADTSSKPPYGEMVREIDDPSHGRPLAADARSGSSRGTGAAGACRRAGNGVHGERRRKGLKCSRHPAAKRTPSHPVIHAGDALIVEEHTAVVDARLEAVALSPAAQGRGLQGAIEDRGQGGACGAVSAGQAVFAAAGEGGR